MLFILTISMAQAIVACYLLWSDFKKKSPEIYLLILMILIGAHLSIKLILLEVLKNELLFNHLVTAFNLGLGPLLYLYIKSKSDLPKVKRKEEILHLLPLFLVSIIYFIIVIISFISLNEKLLITYRIIVTLLVLSSSLIYFAYLSYLFYKKQDCLKNVLWLKTPVHLFLITAIITFLWVEFVNTHINIVRYIGYSLLFYLVLCIIKNYRVSAAIIKTSEKQIPPEKKYKNSGLKEHLASDYLTKLEALMHSEKLYLQSETTLEELAERIGCPKHHLTEALNSKLQKNFYQYINEYRINDAIDRLKNGYNKSFQQLSYDLGFNSKATFNSYFKKITGNTPKHYRNSVNNITN